MANKILVARGTKARIEEVKSSLSTNELVYSTDTGELGVKKANGNIEYFMNAADINALVNTLETSKQDKLVAGYNITIDENTNVISASGGEVDPNAMAYFDYAGSIYGDKYSLLANAWESSLAVDPSEISVNSSTSSPRGTAQYPNGETEGVIIPQGVTTIGNYAFYAWQSNNQPLVIPNSVTSIGSSAFQGWSSNNQPLVIPNSVTSIGGSAFRNWQSNNQPLVIPNSVTSIGSSVFNNWSANNQPLVIPDSVTSIGSSVFRTWTSNNHPLVIPDSVTSIGGFAFQTWQSNTHPLVIPESVTSIGDYAFDSWSLVPYVEIQAITPPSLANANAFGRQNNAPIYVPDESVEAYKTATNWVDLASRIFPIIDMPNVNVLSDRVDTHIEDLNNPHAVTAEQVDTYVKTTIDNKDANTLQAAKDYTYSKVEIDNKDTAIMNKANNLENANMFKDVNYNNVNGVLTFTKYDDTTKEIDLPLELLVESGYYDEAANELVLVLANSSEIRIPVSNLLTDLDAHNIRFNGSGTNYLTAKTKVESAIKELDTIVKANADGKLDKNTNITGATKTKITYDSKGLVTAGADLVEADIPALSTSKITQTASARFVTDTEKTTWNNKVDKVSGMGLSSNDFTTTEKNKLSGIQAGAQVNEVNSVNGKQGVVVLNQDDIGDGATYKQVSQAEKNTWNNKVDKVTGKGLSTEDYTTAEKTKLSGIEAGAQVNTVTSVAGKTGAVVLAKSDVGLGSVQNYAIASKTEAEAGTSNALYMTPLRTKEAITANARSNTWTPTWSQVSGKPTFATVATTGSYADLTNKPNIPSKTSDLTNDSDFTTKNYVDNKTTIKEQNENIDIKFWTGTQAQYDDIGTKDANTLYFIEEE